MSFERASLPKLIFALSLFTLSAVAQQPGQPVDQQPGQPAGQQPVQAAPPPVPQTAPSSAQPVAATQPGPPPEEPAVLEDGGFSIEPMYWLNRAQPALYGGAQAGSYASLSYPGHANPAYGVELSIPTGHSNTLRISAFRVLGNGNSIASQDTTLYTESYSAGDYLAASYTIQSAKVSWDYLSYTWRKAPGNIHFKTLYEFQYTSISTNVNAPFVPVTTDSSGNTDYNTTSGSQKVFLPTLGAELEQSIHGRFRWEVKASGFGIPHHSDIGDVQADVAFRLRKFELIAGEKYYHFKTGPGAGQYFSDTLSGAFVAVRYYFGSGRK